MTEEAVKIPTAAVAPRMEAPKVSASESGTDFKEDPFQNYRYEDPFLISDPFIDEEVQKPEPVKKIPAVFKGKLESLLKFLHFISFFFSDDNFADPFNNKFGFGDTADPFSSGNFTKMNGDSNNNEKFDPFGVSTDFEAKKDSSGFGFDGNFANFDEFNDSAPANGNKNGSDKFDAWGATSLDITNNNDISFGRIKKSNEKDSTKFNKFSSDNFEDDLAQALKRSVVEQ